MDNELLYILFFLFHIYLKNPCLYYKNLETESMQLCVLVASNMICSSACTLAAAQQVDGNAAEFVNGFKGQDLEMVVEAERVRFLFVMSTCAVNREYTGLWSENFDSPLTYIF